MRKSQQDSSTKAGIRKPGPRRHLFLLKRLAVVTTLFVFALTVSGYLYIDVIRTQKGPHAEPVLIDVPPGSGPFKLKHDLYRAGVISHPVQFQLAVVLFSGKFVPKVGEYELPARASLEQIIRILHGGEVFQRKLIIPEGWRSFDVMQALNAADAMASTILRSPTEGSVFPDTYFYIKGTDRRALLTQMQDKMELTLAEIWAEREPNPAIASPSDLLKLASIIEKETGRSEERARVASVFVNRLEKDMRLQSDPTVAYGLAINKPLLQKLTKSDIAQHHSWNTYRIKGLPKTPIANPGYQSLHAAAHPEKTDYLYFVANGEGGHNFAKTLDVHNRNVRQYRKIMKKEQRPSQ